MTSLTRTAYGSAVRRHGRSRRERAYQPRTAARSAASSLTRERLRRRLVALDLRELAPQLADLVAKPRRVLEAQVLGGGEHLLLELDDRLFHLGEREILGLDAAAVAAAAALRGLALRLEELGYVADALDDRRGRDAVLLVVGDLDRAAAVGLLDRRAHRRRLLVGVHQHRAFDVAGRAPDGLDERRLAAQEPLLVGVEDRDQRDLRQIETLAEQVDADQHVELAEAQVAQDLDAFDRVDVGVEVAHAHAQLEQVVG